jgi:hypothetical protein
MILEMKNRLIPLLFIGLLLSTSFGLLAMNHIDGQGHGQCPFEVTGVNDCSQALNTIDFVASHLDVLSQFSLATPSEGFSGLIALSLLLAFALFLVFNKGFELPNLKPVSIQSRFRQSFVPPTKILLTRWFALHENSPAFIVGR